MWGIHRDRWIPRTKGQLRGKCFHLMTSSWDWLSSWWLDIPSKYLRTPPDFLLHAFNAFERTRVMMILKWILWFKLYLFIFHPIRFIFYWGDRPSICINDDDYDINKQKYCMFGIFLHFSTRQYTLLINGWDLDKWGDMFLGCYKPLSKCNNILID